MDRPGAGRADCFNRGGVGMIGYETLKATEDEWRARCDAYKREADYWRDRHDALLKKMTEQADARAKQKDDWK